LATGTENLQFGRLLRSANRTGSALPTTNSVGPRLRLRHKPDAGVDIVE
jgi:hypothetical protein